MSQLFSDGPATDQSFINIRKADDDFFGEARERCEVLWKIYRAYADNDFQTEIRTNFDARYWEMYLTVSLIQAGHEVLCPKPGPDVGINISGQRVWFEATSGTRGSDNSADQVPTLKRVRLGDELRFEDVPNERILLRFLNCISGKYNGQYRQWLQSGAVSPEDSFVVAINSRTLEDHLPDSDPPRILQVAMTMGDPYVVINRNTLKKIDLGYRFRDRIKKASGAEVETGVFQQPNYFGLSGLLCSRVDAVNQPRELGGEYQLVPNPHASHPLPTEFRLGGTYFHIEHGEGQYIVTPEPPLK